MLVGEAGDPLGLYLTAGGGPAPVVIAMHGGGGAPNVWFSLGLQLQGDGTISDVRMGSPADKAGVLSGDILVSFNDQPVETSDALFKLLTEDKIGQFQYIGVLRNNYKTEFRITPAQKN